MEDFITDIVQYGDFVKTYTSDGNKIIAKVDRVTKETYNTVNSNILYRSETAIILNPHKFSLKKEHLDLGSFYYININIYFNIKNQIIEIW